MIKIVKNVNTIQNDSKSWMSKQDRRLTEEKNLSCRNNKGIVLVLMSKKSKNEQYVHSNILMSNNFTYKYFNEYMDVKLCMICM